MYVCTTRKLLPRVVACCPHVHMDVIQWYADVEWLRMSCICGSVIFSLNIHDLVLLL